VRVLALSKARERALKDRFQAQQAGGR
jgi:hypothetical protein